MVDFRWVLAAVMVLSVCCVTGSQVPDTVDYRQEMRDLVIDLSSWSKGINQDFVVIPQNGQELLTLSGEPGGEPASQFIAAIDATGREDLFFGYLEDDQQSPAEETLWMISFLNIAGSNGKTVMVTDYCSTPWKVDSSYSWNQDRDFISFAADRRELDGIPGYPAEPWNINQDDVTGIGSARNFLYLIDPGQYSSLEDYILDLEQSGFDVLLIDLFWNDQQLSPADLDRLREKPQGGSRLIIAYMSIGEAEDYRYYWDQGWTSDPPGWLSDENPEWEGNYLVEYWDQGWQSILFGSDNTYLDRILSVGFDGVYLDKIDSFETWEEM